MGRNEIIREEAEQWRRQGQITDDFYRWVEKEYPVGRDQGTERRLQQILLAFAGILTIIGIFTLVAEYWGSFTDTQKLWILRLFAAIAIGLGTALYFLRKTRVLSHVLLPLAIPLYLFSMGYADPGYDVNSGVRRGTATLDAQEWTSLVLGGFLTFGALLVGLRRFPTLAMSSTPGMVAVLFFVQEYLELSRDGDRALQWVALGVVFFLHAVLLLAWLGVIRVPYAWDALALRLALFANVPMGFVLIMQLVESYAWTGDYGRQLYDTTVVGVLLTASYVGILLGFGLRLGLPELVGICGAFLIVDAIWLGGSKGGVLGAVLAILATAVLMGVLAQRGLLRRIFKPRAPPTTPVFGPARHAPR